jgi:hypothetical protein
MRSILRYILAILLVGKAIDAYLSIASLLHSGSNFDISLYMTLFRQLVILIGLSILFFLIWKITEQTKITSSQQSIPLYFLVFSAALFYAAATFYQIKLTDFLTFKQHFHQAILVEALFLLFLIVGILSDKANT